MAHGGGVRRHRGAAERRVGWARSGPATGQAGLWRPGMGSGLTVPSVTPALVLEVSVRHLCTAAPDLARRARIWLHPHALVGWGFELEVVAATQGHGYWVALPDRVAALAGSTGGGVASAWPVPGRRGWGARMRVLHRVR
jgi:hypothetical protein